MTPLQRLYALADQLDRATVARVAAVGQRNRLIRQLLETDTPVTDIATAAGLTRQRVWQIGALTDWSDNDNASR